MYFVGGSVGTADGRLTSVNEGLASTLLALTKLSLIPDSEARFRAISS
jgi:hypothetical protein